jgi:hypothetical protein
MVESGAPVRDAIETMAREQVDGVRPDEMIWTSAVSAALIQVSFLWTWPIQTFCIRERRTHALILGTRPGGCDSRRVHTPASIPAVGGTMSISVWAARSCLDITV